MTEDFRQVVSEPGLAVFVAVIDRRCGNMIRFIDLPRTSARCMPVSGSYQAPGFD